jgi:hypothetical protein
LGKATSSSRATQLLESEKNHWDPDVIVEEDLIGDEKDREYLYSLS